MAKKSTSSERRRLEVRRKVTYSLPEELLKKLERAGGAARARSGIVAEALARYFVEREKRELEEQFVAAASDALFREDNESVRKDFAALDAETGAKRR